MSMCFKSKCLMVVLFFSLSLDTVSLEGRSQKSNLEEQTKNLVDRATDFFKKNTVIKACAAFAKKHDWQDGPIALFVINSDGLCLVDQLFINYPWQKISTERDFFDDLLIPSMIARGSEGGWITYHSLNSLRHAFVKL